MSSAKGIVPRFTVGLVMLTTCLAATIAGAQADSSAENRAKAMRRGAGLNASLWDVRGLRDVSGASVDEMPLFEGYFARGLDLHLAMENSVGVYRREQRITRSGGIGGGTVEEKITTYLVPQFTSIKLYLVTRPEERIEPYLVGGAGLTLGVDDRENTGSGGLLGGGAESGTAFVVGFGLKGGAGVELRFSNAFGALAGGRYQWVRMFGDLAGERTFRGFGADVGLVYRFQYD
jgi:hypothetical protein